MHCELGATGLSANSNSQEYSENAAWASATAIYEIDRLIDIDMGEWSGWRGLFSGTFANLSERRESVN